jgi:hypothetical protein
LNVCFWVISGHSAIHSITLSASSKNDSGGPLHVPPSGPRDPFLERTQCCVFSADEGADVGADEGTPVTETYKVPFKFDGKIARVTIELKEMKKADRDDAEQARKAAVLKKGLAD